MRQRAQLLGAVALLTATTSCGSSPVPPSAATSLSRSMILPPVPTSPIFNARVGPRPRFTVTDVPAFPGETAYRFEVSTTSSFEHLLTTATIDESVGQTFFVPPFDLPPGTLYWRAQTVKEPFTPVPAAPSAFSSAQTFRVVPASTFIDPPTVDGPPNGREVEIRATFIVGNARSPNPLAALIYRFDLSLDPLMSRVLVSTTVAEGNAIGGRVSSTTAALSPELSFDTTYFWRAQALDTQSGAASAFTPTFSFRTHGPRPGFAMLHVSIPACHDSIGVTFDGTLTTDGTVARFTDSSGAFGPPTLTFDLSRTADGWSGRALGNARTRDGDEVHILPPAGSTAASVSATEMSGQFSGTFEGSVAVWNSFGDGGGGCSDDFKWVILPPH